MDARYENDKPILVETTAYRDAKTAADWISDILIMVGFLLFAMDILSIILWKIDYYRLKPSERQAFSDNRQAYLQVLRAKLYVNLIMFIFIGIVLFVLVAVPLAAIFMPSSYVPVTN